jgi:hypothetical protein
MVKATTTWSTIHSALATHTHTLSHYQVCRVGASPQQHHTHASIRFLLHVQLLADLAAGTTLHTCKTHTQPKLNTISLHVYTITYLCAHTAAASSFMTQLHAWIISKYLNLVLTTRLVPTPLNTKSLYSGIKSGCVMDIKSRTTPYWRVKGMSIILFFQGEFEGHTDLNNPLSDAVVLHQCEPMCHVNAI